MHLGRSLKRLGSFPTQERFSVSWCTTHSQLNPPTFTHWVRTHTFLSFSRLTSADFADCMTCHTTQVILLVLLETLHISQFIATSYMTDLVIRWITHGSLSRVTQIVFLLGLHSLSWCPTTLKLDSSTYFYLFQTHPFLSFSCLVGASCGYHITNFAIRRTFFQFFRGNSIFSQFTASSWIKEPLVGICPHYTFHNLKGYVGYLIMEEIYPFDVKISVIPMN